MLSISLDLTIFHTIPFTPFRSILFIHERAANEICKKKLSRIATVFTEGFVNIYLALLFLKSDTLWGRYFIDQDKIKNITFLIEWYQLHRLIDLLVVLYILMKFYWICFSNNSITADPKVPSWNSGFQLIDSRDRHRGQL